MNTRIVGLSVLTLSAAILTAAPFQNGSFEAPPQNVSSRQLPPGDTSLHGWMVGDGSHAVYIVRGDTTPGYPGPYTFGDDQYLAFNGGNKPSGSFVVQVFDTQPNTDYDVSFVLGRAGGDVELALKCSVFSDIGETLAELTARPPAASGWGGTNSVHFFATTFHTKIQFTDVSEGTLVTDALLDAVSVVETPPLAGPIINPTNGHEYYLLAPGSWTSAEARAVRLDGHLVTINDELEQLWVYSTFGFHGGVPKRLWIGLTDRSQEGKFKWVSGESSSFTTWAPAEPNNFNGVEHFVEILEPGHEAAGKWNDHTNDRPNYGVVEVARMRLEIQVSAVDISWNSAKGARYQPQYATPEQPLAWHDLGSPVVGDGTRMTFTDSTLTDLHRLYRVVEISAATP